MVWNKKKIPIVVGGTHYYIKNLLWSNTTTGEDHKLSTGKNATMKLTKEQVAVLSDDMALERLKEIDPVMAQRWHPKDTRKIRRSLEV